MFFIALPLKQNYKVRHFCEQFQKSASSNMKICKKIQEFQPTIDEVVMLVGMQNLVCLMNSWNYKW